MRIYPSQELRGSCKFHMIYNWTIRNCLNFYANKVEWSIKMSKNAVKFDVFDKIWWWLDKWPIYFIG